MNPDTEGDLQRLVNKIDPDFWEGRGAKRHIESWMARMALLAIADFLAPPVEKPTKKQKYWKRIRLKEKEQFRRTAGWYLFDDDPLEVNNFQTVCSLLGISIHAARDRILELRQAGLQIPGLNGSPRSLP